MIRSMIRWAGSTGFLAVSANAAAAATLIAKKQEGHDATLTLRVAPWKMASDNFASIHNHSAFAELCGRND